MTISARSDAPPQVRGAPLLGVVPRLYRNPARGLARLHDEAGPVFRAKLPMGSVCFAIGPEANELVLRKGARSFTAEDDFEWLKGRPVGTLDGQAHDRIRGLLHESVNGAALDGIAPTMAQIVRAHVERWTDVSALEASRLLAMETIIRAGLGAEAHELGELEQRYTTFANGFFAPKVRFPGSPAARALAARDEIDRWFQLRIRQVRRDGTAQGNLVATLLAASQTSDDPLSEREIIDNLRIMVVAGQETTASVMAAMLVELAHNDVAWDGLCDETPARAELPLNIAELQRLPWTKGVINESLRRFTPAWFIPRRVADPHCTVANYVVDRGSIVALSPLATHHLEHLWPRPFEFDVERWLGDRPPPRGTYIPFGDGRHTCLGKAMAILQLMQVLVQLAGSRRRPRLTKLYDLRPVLLPFPHVPRKVRVNFQ